MKYTKLFLAIIICSFMYSCTYTKEEITEHKESLKSSLSNYGIKVSSDSTRNKLTYDCIYNFKHLPPNSTITKIINTNYCYVELDSIEYLFFYSRNGSDCISTYMTKIGEIKK